MLRLVDGTHAVVRHKNECGASTLTHKSVI
jgi:hypothetical protein